MNAVLALVAAFAALNPPRTRLGLPGGDGSVDRRRAVAGILAGGIAILAIGAVAPTLFDALEISPETFRIAAGFVFVIVAAWMLFVPTPTVEPDPPGAWGLVWPVAYPRVVSPETITLALTVGASDGLGTLATSIAVALGSLGLLSLVKAGPVSSRVLAACGRVVAVGLVLVAIWLTIQGVREV